MFRCGVLFLLKDGTEKLAFVCLDSGGTYSSGDDYLSTGGRQREFSTESEAETYWQTDKKYFLTSIPFGRTLEDSIASRKFVVVKISYDIVASVD